jgi:spore maturation protein CgeB
MIITVEGYIDANGNFVVEEIEEDHASENETEGFVTAVTDTTITISVNNVDMTFSVNNETRMIDEQDEDVAPVFYFSLTDIAIGDFVEIDYYTDDISGNNIATEIERDDGPS